MNISDIKEKLSQNHAIEYDEIIELCNAVQRKDIIIDALTQQIQKQVIPRRDD